MNKNSTLLLLSVSSVNNVNNVSHVSRTEIRVSRVAMARVGREMMMNVARDADSHADSDRSF